MVYIFRHMAGIQNKAELADLCTKNITWKMLWKQKEQDEQETRHKTQNENHNQSANFGRHNAVEWYSIFESSFSQNAEMVPHSLQLPSGPKHQLTNHIAFTWVRTPLW